MKQCIGKGYLFSSWFIFLYISVAATTCYAAHGLSLDGELKYPAGFTRFDYTSPDAKKGGELVLNDLGSFDKLNPFTLKGIAPSRLSSYVFETLAVQSLDEPFASYGLLAKDIELAEDRRSVTFTINEKARFSDGAKVTVDDVQFSLETLKKDPAHPFYQIYFQDIVSADIVSEDKIRFNFARVNRELHLIAGQLPILSKSFYSKYPFGTVDSKNVFPVGSGPYVISKVNLGKTIEYKKNPEYWGDHHPTRKGMFNFDKVLIKYFKDPVVSVEAFKAGEFDLMLVNIAKQWERDLVGRRFDNRELVKAVFPHKNNAGMQCFVFNTRKPLFSSPGVREALGLAFDFEWTNSALFFNQYKRSNSFFANSELAATGLPSKEELALLEPFKSSLPPEVFSTPIAPPATTPPGSLRKNLRKAMTILKKEGWQIKDGALTNGKQRFTFEILLGSPTFERVMAPFVNNLKKMGIEASYRTIDPALYADRVRAFDFDMTVTVFGQSQSPGNEQRDFWTSEYAKREGSRNLAGIENPVVDALVDKIVYAETRGELITACRSLDRVLWYGYYVIPNWYLPNHRLAYVSRLKHPVKIPLYYNYEQFVDTWWVE